MTRRTNDRSEDGLRERTEALLEQDPAAWEALPGEEIQALVRELHAQQVALSEENEALRDELHRLSRPAPSVSPEEAALRALCESEQQFRKIFEGAQIGIAIVDVDETIQAVNPFMCRWLGYSEAEIQDLGIAGLTHPEDWEQEQKVIQSILQGKCKAGHIEKRYLTKSGEHVWGDVVANLIYDQKGNLLFGVVTVVDITERKRADKARRESQAQLKAILDYTPALIYIKDLQGRFTLVNRALEEVFEIQPADILGKTVEDLFPADIAAAYKIHDEQALEFGRALQFEETGALANGEQRTFISVKFPIADAEGRVYGLGGISTDITERTWMEEALRASEREKEVILNAMSERFIYYNTDLEIQWANQETEALLGHQLNEMTGRHCYEVWRQREAPCEDCPVRETLATGEPRKSSITTPDGRVWNLRSYPIFRSEGGAENIVGVVELGEDITARTEAEAALRRSEARYQSLFRDSPISLWEEDYSATKAYLDNLRAAGIEDFKTYLERHPEAVIHCVTLINAIDVNRAALDLYEVQDRAELLRELGGILGARTYASFKEVLLAIAAGKTNLETQIVHQTLKGKIKHAIMQWRVLPGCEDSYARVLVSLTDITPLKRAEEAVRRRNRDLAMLNQAARTFSATLEPKQVFERVLSMMRDRLSVMASSIWLVTPPPSPTSNLAAAQRTLVCRYLSNPQDANIQGWCVPWGQGVVGWAAAHNESIWVRDTREDDRHFKAVDEFTGIECRSLLAVPLNGPEGVLGVLELSDNAPHSFNEADVRIAESLAATASVAIRNAQLHKQSRRDAETKTLLLREVNHRVKNNLGAILGLLYVEQRHAPPEARPAYAPILERLTQRVTSLAQIHQMLTAADWAPLLLSELAQRIIYQTARAMTHQTKIGVEISPSPVCLSPNQAHHIALIINELTINTIEHAVAGRDAVRINVQIAREDNTATLIYHSDGPGYPPEVLEERRYNAGLDIIQRMVTETLRGELTLRNAPDGAVAEIRFQVDDGGKWEVGSRE